MFLAEMCISNFMHLNQRPIFSGLRVLGIFRVGASKKRTKQLRDEFDSGKDVKLNDTHNPHEVGALLKEYFRDLPEPLLTRDLYSPLVATRGEYEASFSDTGCSHDCNC